LVDVCARQLDHLAVFTDDRLDDLLDDCLLEYDSVRNGEFELASGLLDEDIARQLGRRLLNVLKGTGKLEGIRIIRGWVDKGNVCIFRV
jgi:hypothetical protein